MWTPREKFAVYFCRAQDDAVRHLDKMRPEFQEAADNAFDECKKEMDRLMLLPANVDWDIDPYRILASKIYRREQFAILLPQRLYAKRIYVECVTALHPGWPAGGRSEAKALRAPNIEGYIDQFNGQKPFVLVKRMEAFKLFATSFFHDPEFPLTEDQYDRAGAALNKCLLGLENWVTGDAEDPITGWHPSRVLASEMFEVTEDKVNDAQHAYAMRLINGYRASAK